MKLVRRGILRLVRGVSLLAAISVLSASLAVAAHGGGHGGWGGHAGGGYGGWYHPGSHNNYYYGGWNWGGYPYSGGYTSPYGTYPGFGGSAGFGGEPSNDSGGYWISNGIQYLWIPYGW